MFNNFFVKIIIDINSNIPQTYTTFQIDNLNSEFEIKKIKMMYAEFQ